MRTILRAAVCLLISSLALAQGRISFVIGSDTGLWDGLDVNDYHCTISGALYTSPTGNTARVMDPAFRSVLTDRHGTPMKLTWWMMAGNMFRLAINTDIPVPSTMPVYLMKRYHGGRLAQWGDELTFHYHDWVWTDYDGDGQWYWNQAKTYAEFVPDFDQTLAELLLEEELFPVSFRSGWHAMNNEWQARLDSLLPYSMHNDWPSVHDDPVEPLDNIYDWSTSPSTFVPFRPSTSDYRIPGNGRGWNVRSMYMAGADSAFMASLFASAASKGIDQVVVLWAHLPETDFPDNLQKVNRAIHAAAAVYPTIDYRYCTAVEAMQTWRKTTDTTRPHLSVEEIKSGPDILWTITSNESLFQYEPFVAVKDRYEQYTILPLTKTGSLRWTTSRGVPQSDVAKMSVAATDIAGNHTIQTLRYLPDDVFIDYGDAGYQELRGAWGTTTGSAFGASYRTADVPANDSAVVRWTFAVPSPGTFNAFIRVPAVSSPARHLTLRWGPTGADTSCLRLTEPAPTGQWNYVGSLNAVQAGEWSLTLTGYGDASGGSTLAADAVKVSALVKERWIEAPESYDAGLAIVAEGIERSISLRNMGTLSSHVTSARFTSGSPSLVTQLPLNIPPMGSTELHFMITPPLSGPFLDTLVLTTDDPRHPEVRTAIHASVREYFSIVDDRDSLAYKETGAWAFSSAGGYVTTSRYAYPAAGVSATFTAKLRKAGLYEISEIVPTTVNASTRARYELVVGQATVDSAFKDQNDGSGTWVRIFSCTLPADTTIMVRVADAMNPVIAGKVLRADAIQLQWVGQSTGVAANDETGETANSLLLTNYPNPFNPTTKIRYTVGESGNGQQAVGSSAVKLAVYDLLGREVAVLVDGESSPGFHSVLFDGKGLASGLYFCRLQSGRRIEIIKMMLAK
jgi:hypothetical protein